MIFTCLGGHALGFQNELQESLMLTALNLSIYLFLSILLQLYILLQQYNPFGSSADYVVRIIGDNVRV
jgi:hypothetical protein